MLCYEENSDEFEAIEEFYNKEFNGETILEISGMFDDGYNIYLSRDSIKPSRFAFQR